MPPPPRIRPYKDFLTPAIHRKFSLAASALLFFCYFESVWMGEWNSLIWSWFPLGIAGIRTGLLFIATFLIFLHRLTAIHVGFRTSYSGWDTFKNYALRTTTLQTFGYYWFSAWLFSEIYLWSAPESADLKKTKLIPRTDRTTLNEKPIYFMSYCFFLSFVQAAIHLWYDYDRIDMPVTKTKPLASSDQRAHLIVPARTQLKSRLPYLAMASLQRAVILSLIAPVLYSMDWLLLPYSVRSVAWGFNRSWAKIFFTLPKSNSLPSTKPFHYTVLLQTANAGFLLSMLWEFGNAAFTAYVAQEPLKNDRPVTYESKDPNGSLLTGLNAKKLQAQAYAFWELVYIAQRFEGRRKIIFEDIDRKGGSTWSQILEACLVIINGMTTRIDNYGQPPALTAAAEPAQDVQGLPRLSGNLRAGLKEPGDLFAAPKQPTSPIRGVARSVGKFAKNHGQSPSEGLSPKLNRVGQVVEDRLLTEQQKNAVATSGIVGLFKDWAMVLLKSEFGRPFRREYRRIMAATVLGSPYGDVGLIVDAIDSLTRLSVCSLTEDKFGNVQRDVKLIIQTLTASVTKLERFKATLALHWTDVEGKRESPEVDTILAALKGGLNDLVEAFGNYSEDLRLSQSEMRMAREAATPAPIPAPAPEMRQR